MTSCVRPVLMVTLLGALGAAPASAQFKPKLPRIGGGGGTDAVASRSPTFNDRVVEITDQRLDALLAGYRAELAALDDADKKQGSVRAAYEEENRKHPARLKDYEARHQAWEQCQSTHVEPAEAKGKEELDAVHTQVTGGDEKDFERRMNAVAERIKAAQANGDMAEVMRLSDSVSRAAGTPSAVAANKASSDLQAAAARCGPEPVRPQPPTPPGYPDLKLDEAGAATAKMTPEQYAIMKERVRYAVREGGEVAVTSSMWAFSDDEIDAMKKRGLELFEAGEALQERGH
jgi:hypothetical protein